jgi:hypothetical protein
LVQVVELYKEMGRSFEEFSAAAGVSMPSGSVAQSAGATANGTAS